MHTNQMLTKIIAGRTISGTSQADGVLTISVDDGSTMNVKVIPSNASAAATGGKAAKVRQPGADLPMDLEGGRGVQIATAAATSSIVLQNRVGKIESTD